MSDPFVGEIRIVGFNFAPVGWAFCNGQILSIAQNQALFSLLGTTYGGDGITTFALPNLQSRVPVHSGQGSGLSDYNLGQTGGTETVVLNIPEIPEHGHPLYATNLVANSSKPDAAFIAVESGGALGFCETETPNATMHTNSIGSNGKSQGHANIQPYLTLNFIIALQGIFPSRS